MPATITNQDAQYAFDLVKRICTEVGPGLPGSPQERERAMVIKRELESHLGAENVTVEEFTLAPTAFHAVLRTGALFTFFSAVFNISMGRIAGVSPWLTSITSLAFAILSVMPAIFNSILYREFVDPLFEQKKSVNVIGRLTKPEAEGVKRLLILSGHHDSAPEFTWLRLLGGKNRMAILQGLKNNALKKSLVHLLSAIFVFVTATMFFGYGVMLVKSLIQVTGVLAGNDVFIRFGTLGWISLAYPVVPSIIIGLSYTRAGKNGGNVPGAADNLSASASSVAICRFLVQNPAYIPDKTEIRFISFGSEEAGLRGSRRYVRRHLEELKRLDARLLNYEVILHPEINILTTDVDGVKNAPEMVASVLSAAVRAGVPYKVKSNPTGGGGSDAGSFSQAGLKAVTVQPFKMPEQMLAIYHQKWDSPEALTLEPLFNVLKLTFEWVRCGGE